MPNIPLRELRQHVRYLYDACYFRLKAREIQVNFDDYDLSQAQAEEVMLDWAEAATTALEISESMFDQAGAEMGFAISILNKEQILGNILEEGGGNIPDSLQNALYRGQELIKIMSNPETSEIGVDKAARAFIEQVNKNPAVLFPTNALSMTEAQAIHYDLEKEVPDPDKWAP
jgi:hypothetical protein